MNYPWESRIKASPGDMNMVSRIPYRGWSRLDREGILTSCLYSDCVIDGIDCHGYHVIRQRRNAIMPLPQEIRHDAGWLARTRHEAADIAFLYFCSEYGLAIPQGFIPGRLSPRQKKHLLRQVQSQDTLSGNALLQFDYYLRLRE